METIIDAIGIKMTIGWRLSPCCWEIPLLALLSSCLAPGDCLYARGGVCEPYQPASLVCGFSHDGEDHFGASCNDDWDPSTYMYIDQPMGERANAEPCPVGFSVQRLADHESGHLGWSWCASAGNASASSGLLRDVPAGSACGLASLTLSTTASCAGVSYIESGRPTLTGCPPGTRLRWVLDRYMDRVDPETLQPQCDEVLHDDACPDGTFIPLAFDMVDIILFCEVTDEGGCIDCPSYVQSSGRLCGLHARRPSADGVPMWAAVAALSEPGVVEDLEAYVRDGATDPEKGWVRRLAERASYHSAVAAWFDLLVAAAGEPATCQGKPVTEGCPEGMVLTCTIDVAAESRLFVDQLCWCDQPTALQGAQPG